MNPSWIFYLKSLGLALIALPFAYLFDKNGFLYGFTSRLDQSLLVKAYVWTFYAFLVIIGGYILLGLGRRVKAYQKIEIRQYSNKTTYRLWAGLILGAALCTLILFIQSGFSQPLFASLGKSAQEIAGQRTLAAQTISANLYNIGLKIFMAFSLALALFFMRRLWAKVASIGLFLVLATFSLAKSPIFDTLILLVIISLFVKRPKNRTIIAIFLVFVLFAWIVFFLTGVAGFGEIDRIGLSLAVRIIYGQFADLPFYFDLFSHQRLPPVALLPPYVQAFMGASEAPASRRVMEAANAKAVKEDTAGVASSIFIGEAYAVAGIPGVIIAPFWVLGYFVIIIYVFTSLPKNIFNVFFFAFLFDKSTTALFSGFSYFVFSGIQVIMIVLIYIALVRRLAKRILEYKVLLK
jgi:hypothetical protein